MNFVIISSLRAHLEKIFNILIVIFPIAFLATPNGDMLLIILFLLSIIFLIINFNKIPPLEYSEKLLSSTFIFYFLVQLIYFFIYDADLREIDTPSRFILVLPILYVARGIIFKYTLFGFALNIAIILAGLIAVYQIFSGRYESSGFIDSGNFSLITSIFASFALWKALRSDNKKIRYFYILGFILGLLAIIFSGIRTTWAIFLIVNLIILYLNKKHSYKKIIAASILFLITIYSIFPNIHIETERLIVNTKDYVHGKNLDTSTGHRFELYKASYLIFINNPMGVGENNFKIYKDNLIKDGLINKYVLHHINPHSEIIASLIEQGILGLISTVLTLIIPFLFFYDNHKRYLCEESMLGLIFISHFMLFAITSGIFDHQVSTLFFTSLTVIIYSYISVRKKGLN